MDSIPSENRGNYIFLSFLSICATYLSLIVAIVLGLLYIAKKYFNLFLNIFIVVFAVTNEVNAYLIDYRGDFSGFISNKYAILDLSTIIIVNVVMIMRFRFSIKPKS